MKRPDFEPGNSVSITHGANSERRFGPLAEQLAAEAIAAAPELGRPRFRWAVKAWATAEAKAQLIDEWCDEHGWRKANGDPLPAIVFADRLHARAESLRARLALDTASLSRIMATLTVVPAGGEDALAQLQAEGRRIIEARQAAAGPALPVAGTNHADHHDNGRETAIQTEVEP
ncbi:MAG: hypothetical protein WB765_21165 [Acidimicrobiales bacterium]|jgi:hypothetical protein